jgi:aspartyl/asparaginyl-tRNA synthetase
MLVRMLQSEQSAISQQCNVSIGFGIGFERMVMFGTGMANIRDTVAFARHPHHCRL